MSAKEKAQVLEKVEATARFWQSWASPRAHTIAGEPEGVRGVLRIKGIQVHPGTV